MRIVLFTHPSFLTSQSMPRFAEMLVDGMRIRGHDVEVMSPKPTFYNFPFPTSFKKWLGYIDQYFLFPRSVKSRIKSFPANTLFVFADQALGPWVPLVSTRPHVIHCHDFLAQRSAEGAFLENPVSWTGVRYQRYIRKGYLTGSNFIAVSKKTQSDLHDFYGSIPPMSEVVYNGLSGRFLNGEVTSMRQKLSQKTSIPCEEGYFLHVGGNQWYKNRKGVIEIYNAWRNNESGNLPLILIGAKPNEQLSAAYSDSKFKDDIYFLSGVDDNILKIAYAGASVFLFPSLAEGFGWPIAEAMASGVPVITTNEAPMTEVAGDAAVLIGRMPLQAADRSQWARDAAVKLARLQSLDEEGRGDIITKGFENIKRFDSNLTLGLIEEIYLKVLNNNI